MKMEIKLTPKEVEEIIKQHLAFKFKSVGEVQIKVSQELRGHYTNEYYAAVFKGATCEVEI